MANPIDVASFEPFMPDTVRQALLDAKVGTGPAADWFDNWTKGYSHYGLVRSFSRLPAHLAISAEIVGWLTGIGMFTDSYNNYAKIIQRERLDELPPYAQAAFAVGVRIGIVGPKRLWKSAEILVDYSRVVTNQLRDVLPLALVSDSALTRGIGLKIAQRVAKGVRAPIEAALKVAETKSHQKRLATALAALTHDEKSTSSEVHTQSALLLRLVAAYGQSFDPQLHEPISRLGLEESRRREPLRAASKGELEGAWLALASRKDPGDVEHLLNTPWPGAWLTAVARVSALGKFPPDPRIAERLPALAKQYQSWGARRLLAEIERVVKSMRGTSPRREDQPRAAALQALLDEANSQAIPTVDIASVWRDFYVDPSDPSRQLVLSDALQTVGDPRGEFIVLSSAIANGQADVAIRNRTSRLLEANIDRWCGQLPGLDRPSRRFERGFLARVHVHVGAKQLEESLNLPEWSTIRELHVGSDSRAAELQEPLIALLASMPMLKTVVLHMWQAEQLVPTLIGCNPNLTAIGCADYLPALGVPLPPGQADPGFKLLGTRNVPHAAELFGAAGHRGLQAVLLFAHLPFPELLQAFDQAGTTGVAEARFSGYGGYSIPFDPMGWLVRVSRKDTTAHLCWGSGRYQPGSLTTYLQTLVTSGRRELKCRLPKVGQAAARAEAEAIRPSLEAQGVALRLDAEWLDVWAING